MPKSNLQDNVVVDNYLQCCSELMRLFNNVTQQHLHDSDSPFREYRDVGVFDPKEYGLLLGRLRSLYSDLHARCEKKDDFVKACKTTCCGFVRVKDADYPFSELCATCGK